MAKNEIFVWFDMSLENKLLLASKNAMSAIMQFSLKGLFLSPWKLLLFFHCVLSPASILQNNKKSQAETLPSPPPEAIRLCCQT